MAKLGSPLAFTLGGAPSEQQQVYDALKVSVGEGNSVPGSDWQTSIIESWRMAKARGLAACIEDHRALSQNWPNSAVDMIPMFEELLDIGFKLTVSDQEKRDVLTVAYTRLLSSVESVLTGLLQQIDSTITIVLQDHDLTRETQMGRGFQDWDPAAANASGPPMNLIGGAAGPNATAFPNFSDDFVFLVLFPLLAGAPITESYLRKTVQIQQLMNEVMPAWCNSVIFATGTGVGGDPCGFILDTDRLDLTVFCA